jgi:hypothetical protein
MHCQDPRDGVDMAKQGSGPGDGDHRQGLLSGDDAGQDL